jgi:uncharacterized membrane protein (UPF0127 family)
VVTTLPVSTSAETTASVSTSAEQTSTVPTSVDPTTTTVPVVKNVDTGDVTGFEVGEVTLAGERLTVALADERSLRRRGLMGVVDLGDLDGMLFVMDSTVTSAFTMRDTFISLHIAFFSESGELVDLLEMTPCQGEPCPSYQPGGAYRFALEVPLGRLSELEQGAMISVKG